MDSRTAFFESLERFGITAASISESSGVPQEVISKYRNQKQKLRQDTFDRLVNALPDKCRAYYFFLRSTCTDAVMT